MIEGVVETSQFVGKPTVCRASEATDFEKWRSRRTAGRRSDELANGVGTQNRDKRGNTVPWSHPASRKKQAHCPKKQGGNNHEKVTHVCILRLAAISCNVATSRTKVALNCVG